MTKAKTNALDALRSLIAERQQYEQWISALESRREGTPEHVFERVRGDYQSRLERVVQDIRGHAEELQLSISTLSSRLVEVARDEDTRREGLQEAELRAAVGEYEPEQWEQLRTDAEKELAKIAADRASLDSQLGELRAIQKLSEATGGAPAETPATVASASAPPAESPRQEASAAPPERPAAASTPAPTPPPSSEAAVREAQPAGHRAGTSASAVPDKPAPQQPVASAPAADAPVARQPEQERPGLDPVAAAASAAASAAARSRATRTPPGGVNAAKGRSEPPRPDSAKTLKCPECGTANYPTEWYCERCGGELATM
jgi:hypothetical protein